MNSAYRGLFYGMLVVHDLGGNCPVQASGTLDGMPFYFRARGSSWEFSVSFTKNADPIDASASGPDFFYMDGDWGQGPCDAGWMTPEEAWELVVHCADHCLRRRGRWPLPNAV